MKRAILVTLAVMAAWPSRAAGPPLAIAQKAEVRAENLVAPLTWAGILAGAGIQQWRDRPDAWGSGMAGFGRRTASSAGRTAVRETFAFALDAALRTDPRTPPSPRRGVRNRVRHALVYTVVARTDAGRPTFAVAGVGGRVGAELLANTWYPDGDNATGNAFARVGIGLAIAAATNVALEFWPDLRARIFHRRAAPARSTIPPAGRDPAPPSR